MLLWRSSCSCSDIFYDDLVFFYFSKLSIPRSPSLRACQIWQSAHVTANCPCIFASELKVILIIIRLELVRPRLGSLPQTRSSSSRRLESPKTRPKVRRFVNCSSLQCQRARLFGFLYLRTGASLRVLCFISLFHLVGQEHICTYKTEKCDNCECECNNFPNLFCSCSCSWIYLVNANGFVTKAQSLIWTGVFKREHRKHYLSFK